MTTLARDDHGRTAQALKPGATQSVPYTGTAGTSAALSPTVSMARLVATSACFYKISDAGTAATSSDVYLPANAIEYIGVKPGVKISFVQASASGTAYIMEGA